MCSILGYCGKGSNREDIKKAMEKTHSRGPDDSRLINTGNGWMGFNRLSIMGLTPEGMQPFLYGHGKTLQAERKVNKSKDIDINKSCQIILVCNGEIYGFRPLKEELVRKGYQACGRARCWITEKS